MQEKGPFLFFSREFISGSAPEWTVGEHGRMEYVCLTGGGWAISGLVLPNMGVAASKFNCDYITGAVLPN